MSQPLLYATAPFIIKASTQVIPCESAWDDEKVGKLGERGYLQIHPIHRSAMRENGLEFNNTHDRMKWGYRLYLSRGWEAWRWCGVGGHEPG